MKKYMLIIIIAALVLIFCSCGKFDIVCSIDENNVAELRMDMNISKEGLTGNNITYTSKAISDVERHLQANGYTAEVVHQDDSYSLSFTKRKECQSAQEALDTLLEFMSDDASPFSYAEGGYSQSFFNDIYNINATLDMSNIIAENFLSELTPSRREKIEEALDLFKGTVTFELYGDTVEYTGALSDYTSSEEINLRAPLTISRVMSLDNAENIAEHAALTQRIDEINLQKQKYKTWLIILGAAGAVLVISLLAILIRRKLSKTYYH